MNRRDLRRTIMRGLGDMIVLTATEDGDTTTFIDAVHLHGEPGHYAGRLAYISGGTAANLDLTRSVRGSSQSATSITFQLALPAATATGDELELVNTFGMGWTFEDIHNAINEAIAEASTYGAVPISTDVAEVFDEAGTRTVAIPDTFVGVNGVQVLDDRDQPVNVRRANVFGANGWAVDHANREILIAGRMAALAHERTVRLYGYGNPEPLDNDDDDTALDPEWLHHKIRSILLLNPIRARQGTDWQGQGLYHADEANRLRARLTPNFSPSYVRL